MKSSFVFTDIQAVTDELMLSDLKYDVFIAVPALAIAALVSVSAITGS